MFNQLQCSETKVRQDIMAKGCGRKLLSLWQLRMREREKERERKKKERGMQGERRSKGPGIES